MIAVERARPPLRRLPDRGAVAGLCTGIAATFQIPAVYVQAAFVVTAALGGTGIAVYALGWVLVPPLPAGAQRPPQPPARGTDDGAIGQLLGVALVVLAGLFALRHLGLWIGDGLVWPLALGAAGGALIWRETDGAAAWTPTELRHPMQALRARWRGEHGAEGRRIVVGVGLIAAAALLLLSSMGSLQSVGNAVGGVAVFAGAGALVFAPWLSRMARTLADERTERIRSQERAEVAAHLHDSVLQTLALIQKRSGDPREVAGLARRQERELRSWLADRPTKPASESVAAALAEAAAEIEALHRLPIEVVTVGDAPLDPPLAALVAAAREAMANAAKFAGSDHVDLYAEVTAEQVEVFVRDRGVGFDPAAVPDDRHGIRESIVGRMRRHGGRATVHSAPGVGTEVELSVQRRGEQLR